MLRTNAMETYKQSTIFRKSYDGFDRKAYESWKECFDLWVIPMAIDVSNLEEDNRLLKEKISILMKANEKN